MSRLIDVDGAPVLHYPYRQFVVEADGSDPGVPVNTNLPGVTVTATDPSTGDVLVARNGDTGDPVSLVTDARGETLDLVYLTLPQINVSAPGSKVYSVTTSDLGALVAELQAARLAAEQAVTAATAAADLAAQARDAAASSATAVLASDSVTLANRLFGADWQTASTLLPSVIPAGSGGGEVPADLQAQLDTALAEALARAEVVWRGTDGTWPEEPAGPGQVFVADDQPTLPAPTWVASRRVFRLRVESTV